MRRGRRVLAGSRGRQTRATRRRRFLLLAALGALFHVALSWLLARRLAERLVSPVGLAPAEDRRDRLLAALTESAPLVAELRHPGSAVDPVELSTIFASPGNPERRATVLFLHGKGGNSGEWEPDARRALALGYNVLLPDLRGHGASAGRFVTYGLLEREDLLQALAAARGRFGLDPDRIGVHSCSAGSAVALAFAAGRAEVRAIWLESPFADPSRMARRYLSLLSGLPEPLLHLAAVFATARARRQLQRHLALPRDGARAFRFDPLRAAARVDAPICLVYGERDRLVPPALARRFEQALAPGSEVWRAAGAGHCHHEDEAQKTLAAEYERRWRSFFGRHLPAKL